MKTIQLKCNRCQKKFLRNIHEHNHNISEGRINTFCSKSCSAQFGNGNRSSNFYKNCDLYKISNHCGNRRDELSPFKSFLNKGRSTFKTHAIKIDAAYLKHIWEKQKGICPYTGIKMVLPETTSIYHQIRSLKRASLDRIDSSKDYEEGNVEFVCMAINNAKNNYTKDDMMSFLKEIKMVDVAGIEPAC